MSHMKKVCFRIIQKIVSQGLLQMDEIKLIQDLKKDGGFLGNRVPEWLQRKKVVDKNICFIDFKNLMVVEVRASGLMRGFLRFPTIDGVRRDKKLEECNTIKDIEEYDNVSFSLLFLILSV